ncbi:MAG: tRNA (N(6)-L-threonylcarbamoyladenosine(37)-C(2))-methylthiotransferase MtaB [Candidatus Falkowbacteria bacterium]
MSKLTYKLYHLGCKVNQYDAGSLIGQLEGLGFESAKNEADLVLVNTCTVTQTAVKKDLRMVERARKENPNAKIAITGCLPVNYLAEAEQAGVDYIAGVGQSEVLLKKIKKDFKLEEVLNCVNLLSDQSDRSRYFMKVQDGCRQFCSYCIIAHNRGPLRSESLDKILVEAREAIIHGFKEFVLCGIHLGLYGVDVIGAEKINLVYLLKQLLALPGMGRIRMSSIEVTEVTDELIMLMMTNRKMCRHLHIPLQSGNDKILKSMNRPYTTEYFKKRIEAVRIAMPEVAITTDVIVGFPGESETDFAETLDFCDQINFSKIHVFPYSAHEKTPAASFPGQLDNSIKKQRARALQTLSDDLEKAYLKSFINKEIEVVVDARSDGNKHRGKSEYYFDVEFESEADVKTGDLIKVKFWQALK